MKIAQRIFLPLLLGLGCLPMLGVRPVKKLASQDAVVVSALLKTDDVETAGDAADDSCTYVNKKEPGKSLIIGTDKKSGLVIYDLSGKRQQKFADGNLNNVDLRYGFSLGGREVALISVGNRSTNTIDFYYVDEDSNEVKRWAAGVHDAGLEIYGSCMYQHPLSKKIYVFVNSKDGEVIQWEVNSSESKLTLGKVREFDVGSQVEGCVADDELGRFYIGEEAVGIWRYGAEARDGSRRIQIDNTGAHGNLVADVEGLTLYRIGKDDGYLLASSQGENGFNVYKRKSGEYVGKFYVEFEGKRIEDTDGIDVTSHQLSEDFPNGLLVVQDGSKANPRQSFKFVSWKDLADKFSPPLKRSNREP